MLLSGITLLLIIAGCSKQTSIAPILVLATESDFGTYTGEILRAEGFNSFIIDSLKGSSVSSSYLSRFPVVILSESVPDAGIWDIFSEYVREGGNLIVVRPQEGPAGLTGLDGIHGTISGGGLVIDTTSAEGVSLSGLELQLHTEGYLCDLRGARVLASLTDRSVKDKKYPGVVVHDSGKGKTATFLYNLPENIILTRQGNPAFADTETDGINGLRPMDLFTGGWINISNNIINQADEQMNLLTHIIESMCINSMPLPRLWYFPDQLKCLVTLTNDGENSTEAEFEPQFADVEAKGAKMTLYVLETDKISKDWVTRRINKGHEISGHPDNVKNAGDPDWQSMEDAIRLKLQELNDRYGITHMHTNTNHWFVWCGRNADGTRDFAAQARLEEKYGIGLDCNYAHYDNGSGQGHFLGSSGYAQGNYTGSGLVMKFADADGRVIDVYQQLNNVYDQQYMEQNDQDGFFDCFKGLVDRSLCNEVYSYICIRAHNNEYFFSKVPLMNMLDYANSKGIPVWTEQKLLDFLRMRDEACFTDISWSHNKLSFDLRSSLTHVNNLSVMLPHNYGNMAITKILKNDDEAPFIVREVKGSSYAFLTVEPGADYSIAVIYGK